MKKLFRRSSKDRVLAGICGGLGEYTNTDPIIWRLATALLTIGSLSGLFWAYLITWIIVPEEE